MEGGTQLGFDLEVERLVRVTPARLGIWDDCPRRYRLTYVDRPPPPRGGPQAANTLGAVVHLALRAVFERPAAERTPAAGAALVDRYWNSEGFRDDEQAATYRTRARGWVADYLAELVDRPEPIERSGLIEGSGPDEELAVGLERWVSVGTGRVVAEGRVDRIDRHGDELVVVDYKTGRRTPTEADAAASQALALYAMATERTLHGPCTQVELHHLPSGVVAAWRHDRASLAAHLRRAEDAAGELSAASDGIADGADPDLRFPARPAPRCTSCPMRRNCPEGAAMGPQAQPWAMLAP